MSIEHQNTVKTEHAPSVADLEAAGQLIAENELLKSDPYTTHVFDQKGLIAQEGGKTIQVDLGNWLQERLKFLTEHPIEERELQEQHVRNVEAEIASGEYRRDAKDGLPARE